MAHLIDFQFEGGCGGNGNNFASMGDCRRKCLADPAGSMIIGGIEGEQKQILPLGESMPAETLRLSPSFLLSFNFFRFYRLPPILSF
jgi:hypothetical protein